MKKSRPLELISPIITVAVFIALYYFTVRYALPFLLPFLLAFAVAALLQKPIRFLAAKTKIKKKVWAIILSVLFFLIIGSGIVYLGYYVVNTIYNIILEIPEFINSVADELSSATESKFTRFIEILPDELENEIIFTVQDLSNDFFGGLQKIAVNYFSDLASMLQEAGVGEAAVNIPVKIASLLVSIAMFVISMFYITLDYEGFKRVLLSIVPKNYRATAVKIKNTTFSTIIRMLKTYATLMLITFLELIVGFSILSLIGMKIPYIPILAAAIALVDILPVLGVGTVLIPWAIIDILLGNWGYAVMLLVLYLIIWLVRNFTEPKLVGDSFGVHPVIMLLAIYTGGKLLGILGIFLLPLTVVIVKKLADKKILVLFDEIKTIRQKSVQSDTE